MPIKTVLFDLDGTLLDTARDFAFCINLLLKQENKPPVNFELFRKQVHGDSKKMVAFAFDILETDSQFECIRKNFLDTYQKNCTQETIFFDGMTILLDQLDAKKIPWGVVTNKPTWLTNPVAKYFGLENRACCIISGDTLPNMKPHPEPLQYACKKIGVKPEHAVFVGDTQTDILAAKAAGTKSIGVTYGYH